MNQTRHRVDIQVALRRWAGRAEPTACHAAALPVARSYAERGVGTVRRSRVPLDWSRIECFGRSDQSALARLHPMAIRRDDRTPLRLFLGDLTDWDRFTLLRWFNETLPCVGP